MKEGIVFYFGICVLAITLKYVIGKLNVYFGKSGKEIHHEPTHAHNHEVAHFIAHLVKYLLLILFAILAYKLLNGSFNQNLS